MTRIERIIKNARMVLADKNADRWTDDDLLSILDEGHKDLCQQSKILTARAEVTLTVDSPFFTLPDDCWQLTRATFDNQVLPFVTYNQLDELSSIAPHCNSIRDYNSADWQTDVGLPEAIVYDRRNMSEGRVYPTPDANALEQATFSSPFGVSTESEDGTVLPVFGFSDSAPGTDPFGLLTAYSDTPELACYYLQIPADLEELTDDLATPRMFDTALKYYVIGNAFLTDLAEEYQAKGVQQLGFYSRELELAMKTSARDHQRAGASHTTYRTGF